VAELDAGEPGVGDGAGERLAGEIGLVEGVGPLVGVLYALSDAMSVALTGTVVVGKTFW
jgi:hypothetical protein